MSGQSLVQRPASGCACGATSPAAAGRNTKMSMYAQHRLYLPTYLCGLKQRAFLRISWSVFPGVSSAVCDTAIARPPRHMPVPTTVGRWGPPPPPPQGSRAHPSAHPASIPIQNSEELNYSSMQGSLSYLWLGRQHILLFEKVPGERESNASL